MTWQQWFTTNSNQIVTVGEFPRLKPITIEDLYQAFKARSADEAKGITINL